MKIEKISDNQIKCTLNKSDLASREIKISELAYGTNKAKDLFRDMMKQASYEFGFEADDIPLMIEAIPISADCIVLIITKVEDPEELDTRFSKFAPIEVTDEDDSDDFDDSPQYENVPFTEQTLDVVADMIKQFGDAMGIPSANSDSIDTEKTESKDDKKSYSQAYCYSFTSLEDLITACHYIKSSYKGESSVFKTTKGNYLITLESKDDPKKLVRICNILSEYGRSVSISYPTINFFDEHYETIIKNNAIKTLSNI